MVGTQKRFPPIGGRETILRVQCMDVIEVRRLAGLAKSDGLLELVAVCVAEQLVPAERRAGVLHQVARWRLSAPDLWRELLEAVHDGAAARPVAARVA